MQEIKDTYGLYMERLKEPIREFPWHEEEAYAQWLSQTYHYVKYSTRLLTLSSTHVDIEDLPLHNRFIDHALEERNHEILCVNDLKHMGKDINDYPEHFTASNLYQSQFFWINYKNPMSFFGYILFFEGLGSLHGQTMYEFATKHHGAKSGMFLKVHSDEDPDHIVKAFQQIERFSPEIKTQVIENFIQTTNMYYLFMKEAERCARGENYNYLVA